MPVFQVKLCPAHEESRIMESKEKTMFLTLVSSLGDDAPGDLIRFAVWVMERYGKSERKKGPKQLETLSIETVLSQELPDEPLFKDNLDFIPQAARGEWKRHE